MKFIVFGLGHFGSALSQKLVKLGHEVIGVDNNPDLVDKYKGMITHTIQMDATSRDAMNVLPLKDTDAVVVGIGENEGVNVMTTALLKDLGVERLICRVTSPLQKTILEAMNIKEFSEPEADSAERLAYKLDFKGALDSFRVSDEFQLLEVLLPARCEEKKVSDLELREKYNLQLVTVLRGQLTKRVFGSPKEELKVLGIVEGTLRLKPGDILLLFGKGDDLERFIEER
ncbi:MAG TPA: TrkA family potassium uptake protein [Phnomibacter sp.]|nr:TrkA family potassium uptake protein [Phnomibacter sp.]